MLTFIWTLCKYSNVNPVVADIFRLRLICNFDATILPSVFFHPGLENNMADDASRWLDLPNLVLLPLFAACYSPVQL